MERLWHNEVELWRKNENRKISHLKLRERDPRKINWHNGLGDTKSEKRGLLSVVQSREIFASLCITRQRFGKSPKKKKKKFF